MKSTIESALDQILSTEYGATITHADMAYALQKHFPSRGYYMDVNRLKREAANNRRMLEVVRGVGYRVVSPDDYAGCALRQYRLGAKRLSAGSRILQNAPMEEMSREGLVEHRRISDRAVALEAHMAGAIVEMRLIKREHPLLRMTK